MSNWEQISATLEEIHASLVVSNLDEDVQVQPVFIAGEQGVHYWHEFALKLVSATHDTR